MSKKSLIILIVGVVVFVGIVWFVSWSSWSLKQPRAFVPVVEQKGNKISDTSSWKMYKNEKYGFSFKYPNSWKIEELDRDPASMLLTLDPPNDKSTNIVIELGNILYGLDWETYVRKYLAPPSLFNSKEADFDEVLGHRVIRETTGPVSSGEIFESIFFPDSAKSKVFVTGLITRNKEQYINTFYTIFDSLYSSIY